VLTKKDYLIASRFVFCGQYRPDAGLTAKEYYAPAIYIIRNAGALEMIRLRASNNHCLHRDISDLFGRYFQGISVQNSEVRQFPYLNGSLDIFLKGLPGRIDRYSPQSFFRCQTEFGSQYLAAAG
jgi:hypothetical protein